MKAGYFLLLEFLQCCSLLVSGVPLTRIARQTKIIGGEFSQAREFPYQVLLSYNSKFICGGSIISKEFILTAAHCVINRKPSLLQITAGEHIRFSENRRGYSSQQVRSARYIYPHENYDNTLITNDIALIKLSEPLQFTSHVKNVSLPKANQEFFGNAVVTGWGTTEEDGKAAFILRKVELPIVSNFKCRRMYEKAWMTVTDNMMCAGEAGKDACQGDSGGPAVCQGEKNPVICGVVSHGLGCGKPGFPGIFTKVSDYIDWIEKIRKGRDQVKQIDKLKITIERNKCTTNNFFCSSGRGCIPRSFICDRDADCGDSEDERDCKDKYIPMSRCLNNEFRCDNGFCVKTTLMCNGKDDCGDRSDENKCPTLDKLCTGHQCGAGGRCIPNDWKCDGHMDCDDYSDEKECNVDTQHEAVFTINPRENMTSPFYTSSTTPPAPQCRKDEFHCVGDSYCIPLLWRCNGIRGCISGADEIGCSEPVTAIVLPDYLYTWLSMWET